MHVYGDFLVVPVGEVDIKATTDGYIVFRIIVSFDDDMYGGQTLFL